MAVFGAPVAHEDDAERALRAALAMRQQVIERIDPVCGGRAWGNRCAFTWACVSILSPTPYARHSRSRQARPGFLGRYNYFLNQFGGLAAPVANHQR